MVVFLSAVVDHSPTVYDLHQNVTRVLLTHSVLRTLKKRRKISFVSDSSSPQQKFQVPYFVNINKAIREATEWLQISGSYVTVFRRNCLGLFCHAEVCFMILMLNELKLHYSMQNCRKRSQYQLLIIALKWMPKKLT